MNRYIIHDVVKKTRYERITKVAARKLFNSGEKIYICACNLRPGSPWFPEIQVDNSICRDFEKVVNDFTFYNCINNETGKYPSYYRACYFRKNKQQRAL